MASKAGDIVKALCSHCRIATEALVEAAVGDEIVTVACKTCGTTQRYQAVGDDDQPIGEGRAGRRVVDVSSSRRKKPRDRSRRVVSSTGRAIPDVPVPMPGARTAPPPPPPARARKDPLYVRWDQATDKVDSRYARPHREHEAYEVGEAILDKIHGMGIVEEVAEDGALTVLFKSGHVAMTSRPKSQIPARAPDDDDDEND